MFNTQKAKLHERDYLIFWFGVKFYSFLQEICQLDAYQKISAVTTIVEPTISNWCTEGLLDMCIMGHFATWSMLRRAYNPPKTIFRLRFAKSPKVSDKKAIVRGISQPMHVSPINIMCTSLVAVVFSPDSIFCKAPGSKKERA